MFGIFHDAGYKGLYGGLSNEAIKTRKKIPAKENLMDRRGTTELAANQFRLTQAREKLVQAGQVGQQRPIEIHQQVGQEVRSAIQRIGGTMPENLPPAEHIKVLEERVKTALPTIVLPEHEVGGLLGKAPSQEEKKEAKQT